MFSVFEHLLETDKDGQLVLRLATGWQWLDDRTLEVPLRQGMTFHNGEAFDAEIVKLNVEETSSSGTFFILQSIYVSPRDYI